MTDDETRALAGELAAAIDQETKARGEVIRIKRELEHAQRMLEVARRRTSNIRIRTRTQ